MQCKECNAPNDPDSVFCIECGKLCANKAAAQQGKARRSYLLAALLLPVALLIAGFGYYKFFLPDGIAAVVNGEEIRLADVAAELPGHGAGETPDAAQQQVLNRLILERIVLQEARKAGMSLSDAERSAARIEARASSGLDEAAFRQEVRSRYGSLRAYENRAERIYLMNKFISEKIAPRDADPNTAGIVVARWIREVSDRASVRISLASQGQGSGCGGACGKGCGPRAAQTDKPVAGQKAPVQDRTAAARDAGLAYWLEKHGPGAVMAKTADFGCHVQVDILKDNTIIGSLRYQNGTITEL